ARKEYTKYLLTYDPHSPDELRTNIPLQNLDAFYEVYDIKEGDGMYLPPQERVNVW
ncbi:M13-type metalloendopeptidase, partial [Streptococcus pyogenes]